MILVDSKNNSVRLDGNFNIILEEALAVVCFTIERFVKPGSEKQFISDFSELLFNAVEEMQKGEDNKKPALTVVPGGLKQ